MDAIDEFYEGVFKNVSNLKTLNHKKEKNTKIIIVPGPKEMRVKQNETCQAIKKDGNICDVKLKHGSKFCGRHIKNESKVHN